MKFSLYKARFYYFLAVGICIFILLFFTGCVWIGYEVKSQCQNAKLVYGHRCVEALTLQLQDEQQNFQTRNHAVWALGQLGDRQALPVLQSYYTGNIPNQEPLDKTLSQYELKKAINLVSGDTNISAFFWRVMLNEK